MNKYIAMVILKPDLNQNNIDLIQSNIINLFEQKSKVEKVWFLGKNKLDYGIKNYSDGIYIKLEILSKTNNVEYIKEELKKNDNLLFYIIIKNENTSNELPLLKQQKKLFKKDTPLNNFQPTPSNRKVYLLINKNIKLPFCESDILFISDDINKILEYANKKVQEFIFIKGYYTTKKFKSIKDVEKQLKNNWKVEFILENNKNIGQQLLIQEKILI